MGYFNARRLIANERLVAHTDSEIVDLTGLLSALRDAERSQRGYLLTGSETHLQGYRDATKRIHDQISALTGEVDTNPGQRVHLETLRREIGRKLAELERTISLEQAGDHAAALTIVRGNTSQVLMERIRAQVAAMRTAELALLDARAGESERSSRTTIAAIVAPTLVGAALLGLLFLLGHRRMAELEEADRHKDEFLALLAHELRSPLGALCNGLDLIKYGGASEGPRWRAAALMERQLAQLTRLVNDLSDASRIARGKIELRRVPTDLAATIRDIVEVEQPLAIAAGLELEAFLPTEPVRVDGDPVRLTQIFRNLLHNARKYTDRGGRIALRLAVEHDQAVVRIRDTGVGIQPAKLEAIFEMFAQIEPGLPRSQGGLGIGLALARRLVALHEGSIQAFSEGPGRGSEFVVRLPLISRERGDQPGRPAPREREGPVATASADDARAAAT